MPRTETDRMDYNTAAEHITRLLQDSCEGGAAALQHFVASGEADVTQRATVLSRDATVVHDEIWYPMPIYTAAGSDLPDEALLFFLMLLDYEGPIPEIMLWRNDLVY